jgi:methylated-DNA-[protein]-cysteine S-methyltransferase
MGYSFLMLELYAEAFDDVSAGVICDGQKIYGSNFGVAPSEVLESLQRMLPQSVTSRVLRDPSPFGQKAVLAIRDIYYGKSNGESLPLSLERFPIYRQSVLRTVCQIPVGYVASYGGVAEAAGGGARAVGNAMATNCFAPLVPCHRVVTSSLGLGGYGGGLKVKYEFLVREKRSYDKSREILVNGRILQVFPVEFVLKKLEKLVSNSLL